MERPWNLRARSWIQRTRGELGTDADCEVRVVLSPRSPVSSATEERVKEFLL